MCFIYSYSIYVNYLPILFFDVIYLHISFFCFIYPYSLTIWSIYPYFLSDLFTHILLYYLFTQIYSTRSRLRHWHWGNHMLPQFRNFESYGQNQALQSPNKEWTICMILESEWMSD